MNFENRITEYVSKACLVFASFFLPVVAAAKTSGISFSIQSPLPFATLEGFLLAVLNIVIIIATPLVVLAIIYSGFLYVTSRGNVTQTQTATRALTYSIIGAILIIGAVALSEIIKNLVASFAAP